MFLDDPFSPLLKIRRGEKGFPRKQKKKIIKVYLFICMINLLAMIISLIYLGLFSRIASYLITLGLSFIGLSYVILYVGAVSILFLFILMLIYIKIRRGEYISHVVSRYFSRLKCTLMSFEINYKVLSLSKQIHIYISYSTLMVKNSFASVAKKPKVQLNPYFVTGFIYA